MLGGVAGKIFTWLTLGHSSLIALPGPQYISADTVSSVVLGTGVTCAAGALGRPWSYLLSGLLRNRPRWVVSPWAHKGPAGPRALLPEGLQAGF